MRSRVEFGLVLLFDLLGAGLALLVSTRTWQSLHIVRDRPLADTTVRITGRSLDHGPTALAIVALAGVVALLATRGWPRRGVGVLLAVAGVALCWRASLHFNALATSDAVTRYDTRPGINVASLNAHVSTNAAWPTLSVVAGVLIAGAGVLTAWRSNRWGAMSTRYEPPMTAIDAQQERQRADASLWTALDRGDDPTAPEETR